MRHLISLLESLGAKVRRDKDGALRIKVEDESNSLADYESVRKMRASICVLGPLLASFGIDLSDQSVYDSLPANLSKDTYDFVDAILGEARGIKKQVRDNRILKVSIFS